MTADDGFAFCFIFESAHIRIGKLRFESCLTLRHIHVQGWWIPGAQAIVFVTFRDHQNGRDFFIWLGFVVSVLLELFLKEWHFPADAIHSLLTSDLSSGDIGYRQLMYIIC